RHDELPAAAHDRRGAEGGAGTTVPEAVRARSVHGPAAGQPVPLQGRDLPARAATGRLPRRVRAPDRLLLGQGLAGTEVLLGLYVAGATPGPAGRRPNGHLPGDVRPFPGGPPTGVILGPLGQGR